MDLSLWQQYNMICPMPSTPGDAPARPYTTHDLQEEI